VVSCGWQQEEEEEDVSGCEKMNVAKLTRGLGMIGRTKVGTTAWIQWKTTGCRAVATSATSNMSPGQRLRKLVEEAAATKNPLQIVGAINAYSALMAEKKGHKALYLSGGGVALSSLGVPDLGITTLDDVLVSTSRRGGGSLTTAFSLGFSSERAGLVEEFQAD